MLIDNSFTSTAPARYLSTIALNVRICFVVWVAFWAMGLCGIVDTGIATPNVFRVRDGLQVARVYANVNTAKVVEFVAGRHGADEQFVRNDVGEVRSQRSISPRAHGELSILSLSTKRAKPQPATRFRHGNNECHKALYQWQGNGTKWHCSSIAEACS